MPDLGPHTVWFRFVTPTFARGWAEDGDFKSFSDADQYIQDILNREDAIGVKLASGLSAVALPCGMHPNRRNEDSHATDHRRDVAGPGAD